MSFGPSAGAAVLYTPQTLSSAQAGQARMNMSPTNGAALPSPYRLNLFAANSSGYGWVNNANVTLASVYFNQDHGGAGVGELILEGQKSLALVASDGSVNGFVIQLGNANGSVGTDYVYIPPQGVADAGHTTINGQYFMMDCEWWDGARKNGGALLRPIPDIAGNVALTLSADTLGTATTATAQFRAPNGSQTIPGYSIGSQIMGMWAPDSTHLQIQGGTDGLGSYLYLGGGNIITGPADRLRIGYQDDPTANSLQIYYPGCGASPVSSGEWYLSAGATKVATILTAKFKVNTGLLNLAGIPTSSSGLASGDVWSNLGILTIVA